MPNASLSCFFTFVCAASVIAAQERASSAAPDPIRYLVGQLELERYKASIKALTQFGDRRQGTDRKRAALDWIEAQLQSYGCGNLECLRLHT